MRVETNIKASCISSCRSLSPNDLIGDVFVVNFGSGLSGLGWTGNGIQYDEENACFLIVQ